ncbi:outer membrane protein assembly factor BamD [Alteromonas sp. W364]|uniref:outer membrane protein assembly factor BamD n=1 Tax=Alteromonas sp. W364 TaxID=3075610 RepID=UPI002885EC53|nr:outer membrane protein assembly factor BamD [Alteromonas sp. W364]MDT0628811.1 outer membrane protein assembly factor BamD [Alteromonas sp. W364]
MKFTKKTGVAILAASIFTLGGCASSEEEQIQAVANQGVQALYTDARDSMSVGNFAQASQILGLIDSTYPFGAHSHQVQLDLIYSYYKGGKPDQALATIDRFVRLNPNHADVDYAYFMRGVTNMELDNNLFQELLGVDRDDRDPSKSKEAFEDFRRLIQKYPNSKYAADARERMLHIKNRLAKYEIAVARFYMRRQAYVAAANRGRYVIENFPDTSQVQPALEVMVSSYDQLNLTELKENTMRTLRLNYPDSEFLD